MRGDVIEAILRETFDPRVQVKRHTIDTLRRIVERKVSERPEWWRWTLWLSLAITIRRIEAA